MDFLRNIDGLLITFQSFELSLCSLKNRTYAYVLIPVSQYSSITTVTAYRLEDSVRFQIDVGIFFFATMYRLVLFYYADSG
jgi:hypothetical protein